MDIKEEIIEINKVLKGRYSGILSCRRPGTKYYGLKDRIFKSTGFLPADTPLSDRIYYILNNMTEVKKCRCGCGLNVNHARDVYLPNHHTNDPAILKKQADTYKLRHGGDDSVNNKRNRTIVERYGSMDNKSDIVRTKTKETCRKKYGVDNVFKIPGIIEGNVKKWQVNKVSIISKRRQTRNMNFYNSLFEKRLKNLWIPMFDKYEGVVKKYDFKCLKCGNITESDLDDGKIPRCPVCEPYISTGGQSKSEHEIYEYIRSVYGGRILLHNRSVLKNLELDIYMPDINFAVEYCGLYWHSEISGGKDRKYHLNKLEKCLEHGIRLITIFEDEWRNHRHIVMSRLRHATGSCTSSIYARKCDIREVDDQIAAKFIDKYHLQGNIGGFVNIGLYHRNRLVSLMKMGKNRFSPEGGYELLRFCSIFHSRIIGSVGRLFSYFVTKYKPSIVTSYADRRWGEGTTYSKIGMVCTGATDPSYHYMKIREHMVRENRMKYQKHLLKDILPDYSESFSEWQNMSLNGYDRIFDCGCRKYVWKGNDGGI